VVQPPAPPYLGPPAHSSGTNNKPINRVVIHCTVSPCQPGGARDIARYFRSPSAGGSAHYVVDPTEAIQGAWDSVVCWHSPPNSHSLGVELCDPMTGSDARWGDNNHQSMIKRAAVLVAQLCLAYQVPITRLSVSELQAGKRGICGHVDVSQAWKQSTHWDPGPGFPWDQFMTYVRAAAADLQNTTPAPAKDWFDMATQDDLIFLQDQSCDPRHREGRDGVPVGEPQPRWVAVGDVVGCDRDAPRESAGRGDADVGAG
jgi:N-acetyl-anhydromuramyl-L-alanine amidase AmpD